MIAIVSLAAGNLNGAGQGAADFTARVEMENAARDNHKGTKVTKQEGRGDADEFKLGFL